MKKIPQAVGCKLRSLAAEFGEDVLIAELKKIKSENVSVGRPSDLILNTAVLWAHVEFLKLNRVEAKKGKLEIACEMLAGYLDRYTAGARGKSKTTLLNIYKRAPKDALHEPLIGVVMKDAYVALLQNLGDQPNKIPIPYLVQGTKTGWKFPIVDQYQFGDNIEVIGSNGPTYSAAFSMLVVPKNN
jgi:hypothetical protein